ncbi:acireductone dioxygenase [Pseudomonas sp. dw_358]|uniref:acireductone dioxygenase n=1 Tax=Pseudomonas sp. dw_358 TaxID=2720083 RepID=UPI001BD37C15|nr:acireductone dioxygenase [Pseudomonas sp. dw_358]
MSILTVYHESSPELPNKILTHAEDINSTLAVHGVQFAQWQTDAVISQDSSDSQMITAYQQPVDRLMTERGYQTVKVARSSRLPVDAAERPDRLLGEHRLNEDRARFFISGRGLFSLHIDKYVYAVLCEKHDLIVIPAGVAHWLDMGEAPNFVTLRLGESVEGAVLTFTGEEIASGFPRLED